MCAPDIQSMLLYISFHLRRYIMMYAQICFIMSLFDNSIRSCTQKKSKEHLYHHYLYSFTMFDQAFAAGGNG